MTELVAPHRETAQAPLCQFGRGLRVKSQALSLSVCGKIVCQQETRDTGDLYRFGPLRSVIPYSCVLVDLCMNELQSVSRPLPCSRLSIWKRINQPLLYGQGPPFILQGDTTCTLPFPNWTFLLFMDGDWYGCCPNDTSMGQPTPTSTPGGDRRNVGSWLPVADATSARPVILVHHASV